MLADQNDGEAWNETFKYGNSTAISILIIVTVSVQVVLLAIAIGFMMSFIKQGLSWSN